MVFDDIEKEQKLPELKALKNGLYVVATPIGNLRDITMRALDVLRAADIILCEDTRVTKKLLNAYQIKAKTVSYNDHSDVSKRDWVIEELKSGKLLALVSDAGMPLISDPGYKLVKACQEHDIYITTLPGANAPLAALQLSGLPSDQFCFLGFLPHKTKARQDFLKPWKRVEATLICFDASPRLQASLQDILSVLGNREVAVVREITKLYEEVRKGPAEELLRYYNEHDRPKGELVLVIAPALAEEVSQEDVEEMLMTALETMKTKDAAAYVAEQTGLKKKDLYDLALTLVRKDA